MVALRVKDYDRFQHYKDRSPPWIKLYNSLLEDYDFSCLPDASKWHLIAIWLLASRTDNVLPDDAKWLNRMTGATTPIDVEHLVSTGFIERYDTDSGALAPGKQSACLEREKETEGEGEGEQREKARAGDLFGQVWAEYPRRAGGNSRAAAEKAYLARLKAGVAEADLVAGAMRYFAFVRATGAEGTPYVKQGSTFFGPNEHWKDEWAIPARAAPAHTNGTLSRQERNLMAITEGLRRYGNGES
jgi:hypothetical protein